MPDMKDVVPVVVGLVVLGLILISIGWILSHPLILVAIGVSLFLLLRYSARRNRV